MICKAEGPRVIRVVAYCRFSPRPDASTSESNAAQLDSIRAAVAARGGRTIVATFEDADAHGDDAERPGLWQAIGALRRGDELWVDDPKRLARDLMLGEVIRKEVAKKGATVVSVKMATENTLEGEMVRKILAVVAEYEKKANAMLTKSRMQRHQATGRRMSAIPPYGMTADPTDPARMIPEPDEQAIVQRIVALDAAGLGCVRIKRKLEAAGIKCRGRDSWNSKTLAAIIRRSKGHT